MVSITFTATNPTTAGQYQWITSAYQNTFHGCQKYSILFNQLITAAPTTTPFPIPTPIQAPDPTPTPTPSPTSQPTTSPTQAPTPTSVPTPTSSPTSTLAPNDPSPPTTTQHQVLHQQHQQLSLQLPPLLHHQSKPKPPHQQRPQLQVQPKLQRR